MIDSPFLLPMIQISEHKYADLLRNCYILDCLYRGGLNYWSDYSKAMETNMKGGPSAFELHDDWSDQAVIDLLG